MSLFFNVSLKILQLDVFLCEIVNVEMFTGGGGAGSGDFSSSF